jgi:adenosylcobinamide-GDP ribazoletransferase
MSWNDSGKATARADGVRALLADLLKCLRFYSRLPMPEPAWEHDPHGAPDFRTMPRVVPVAGAVIGSCGAAVLGIAHLFGLGAFVTAALTIASLTLVTGAFHEDGLADTADGLGGGATPERRLEIMRDSRIGSYGGAALALAYALRVACLAELIARLGPSGAAAAVVVAAALSRSAGLLLMTLLPPARMAGASYAVGRPDGGAVAAAWAICTVMGLAAALVSPLPFAGVALSFLLAAGAALAMTRLAGRLISGQTGDVGGAVQQLAEIAAYLGLLIAARP